MLPAFVFRGSLGVGDGVSVFGLGQILVSLREKQDPLEVFVVKRFAGVAIMNRVQSRLDRERESLDFFSKIGRIFGLDGVFQLKIKPQAVPEFDNAPLERIPSFAFGLLR